ncbi:MAG: hypothetical protein V3S71_05490, partial [Acidobacteriota bacterium]
MDNDVLSCAQAVPWAEGLRLRRQGADAPKVDKVTERAANVDKRVTEIEDKLLAIKRREKALRKRLTVWRQKQRYYIKKAAAPKKG